MFSLLFRLRNVLAIGGGIFLISVASAQENKVNIDELKESVPKEQKEAPKDSRVEKIQVTGSHIKRIDIEGPSPIKVIDQEALELSGYNSVADVLRDTTVNSFGSPREHSGSNAAGVAHVNLRGLGSTSTLVLLNGNRLPSDGVTGAVDLNLIPMAAVERIEILKDGASAIYGSDALGGVVNIITKKDFTGNEVSLQQSTGDLDGGTKREVSLVNGVSSAKFNMTNVVHYRKNESIFARDREWSKGGVSNIGSPGTYRQINGNGTAEAWQADPNCSSSNKKSTPAGDFCTYNFSQHATSLPELEQVSLMSETSYAITPFTDVRLRMGGSRKEASWIYAPAPGIFNIPSSVADSMNLPGVAPGSDVQYQYRLVELGNRVSEIETNSYNVLIGTKTAVADTWEVEANAAHNRVHRIDKGVSGYALTEKLDAKMADGSFDPSGQPGQRGNISDAKYVPVQETTSELASSELKASGELFDITSGPVSMAIGTQYTQQSYTDKFDEKSVNGEVFGNAGSSGGGSRQTYSVFTEFNVPATQKLELQVASRYDNYSDFGDTINPKVGLRYQATKSLLLRASAGTGFKAPLMQDLYAANSLGFPTFIDHKACEMEKKAGGDTPSCTPRQYQVTSGGNKDLQEEKSQSVNLGAVYQPARSFSIGTDLWMTKLNNVVGIDYDSLTQAEAGGADVSKHGVIVKRDSNGYIESIEAPLQNLASQEVSGIDVTAEGRMGRFSLSVEHSHLFFFKEEGFPGTGSEDILGENGKPAWRNTVTFGVMPLDRHQAHVAARTTGGHKKAVEEQGELQPYTVFDLQYSWAPQDLGELTAGVQNILGTTPPLDDSNPNNQLDAQLYSQLGRQFYVKYSKGF